MGALLFRVVGLLLGAGALAPAQSDFYGRLSEILSQRGLITSADAESVASLPRDAARTERLDAALTALEGQGGVVFENRTGQGWRWETHDELFRLDVGGRLQFRATHARWKRNPDTADEQETQFDLVRARLSFKGYAFDKDLRFEIEFDIAGEALDELVGPAGITFDDLPERNRAAEMTDGFVEWRADRLFRLRAGQFKVPYSRQALTSSADLQFVDRSPIRRAFAPLRDEGIMISGEGLGEDDDAVSWSFGLFNGEGGNLDNDDQGLMWAGRLMIEPFGSVGFSEGDYKDRKNPRVALGLNGWIHQDDEHQGDGDDWSIGADLTVVWKGFSLAGEFHYREDDDSRTDVRIVGWHVQAGWFAIPEKFEIAARFAEVDWDNNRSRTSARREMLLGFNLYFAAHDLKMQFDVGWVEDHEGDHDDNIDGWILRFQAQTSF